MSKVASTEISHADALVVQPALARLFVCLSERLLCKSVIVALLWKPLVLAT